MAYKERITSEVPILEDILLQFNNKCQNIDKERLQKKLDARFSKNDIYGRSWFQMYEESKAAGSVLDVEIQRGFATFYRGIAYIWKIRQDKANHEILPGLISSTEWKEIYNALDDTQSDYIFEIAEREPDKVDTLFRQGVSYLHATQIESMQKIYIQAKRYSDNKVRQKKILEIL